MQASANLQRVPRRSAGALLVLFLGVILGVIVTLTLTQMPAQAHQGNDNLSGAKKITTYQLSHEGSWSYGNNYNATRQRGEPGVTRYNSVWYKWTPPKNGRFWILVETKQFDEMLSVWRGPQSDIRKLRLVAANDDYWFGNLRVSEVEFYAQRGVPLWIAVSGFYPGGEGRFQIEGTYGSLRNPDLN
jgi:hypothetical protein